MSTFATLAVSMNHATPAPAAAPRLWPYLLGLAALLVAVVVFWTTWQDASHVVERHRPHFELATLGQQLIRPNLLPFSRHSSVVQSIESGLKAVFSTWLRSPSYRDLMRVQAGLLLAFLTLLFATALKPRRPSAALLAAAIAATTPAFLGLSLEFNDHLLNLCVVMFAGLTIVRSRGFSRPAIPLVGGVVLAIGVAVVWVGSNGLLMVAALVPLAAVHGFRLGDPKPAPGRLRRFLGVMLFLGPCALLFATSSSSWGLAYVFDEIALAQPQSPASRLAYFPVLFLFQLGPVISAAFLASHAALFTAHRHRLLPWLAWFWATVIVLSLLPKKNEYYVLYALPAVPLAIATAWDAIGRRWARWVLAAAAVGGGLLVVGWAVNGPGSAPPVLNRTELDPFRALDSPVMRYLHAPVQQPGECYKLANLVARAASRIPTGQPLDVWLVAGDLNMSCYFDLSQFGLDTKIRSIRAASWAEEAADRLPHLVALTFNPGVQKQAAGYRTPPPKCAALWRDAVERLRTGGNPLPVIVPKPAPLRRTPDDTARLEYFGRTPSHALFIVRDAVPTLPGPRPGAGGIAP